MEVGFAGGGSPAPFSAAWTAEEMVALFAQVCVETGGEGAAVKAASMSLDMTDKSYDMPVGKNQPPWPLVIARGDGVVVSQAERFLSNPRRQCNITFYLSDAIDAADVEGALAAKMGRPADNDAKRLKKYGKPNSYFSPEWIIAEGAGSPAQVTASPVSSFGPSARSGIQLSFLATAEERP